MVSEQARKVPFCSRSGANEKAIGLILEVGKGASVLG